MKKLVSIVVILIVLSLGKYLLFDFAVSTGKRVGNLTKISKKGKIYKTWEGTIDEGSGDKLTSYFSVSDDSLGQQLYEYEGRQVVIYYDEHLLSFPYDTKYRVTSWKPKDQSSLNHSPAVSLDQQLLNKVQNNLFCSFLGGLRSNRQLYIQVKEFMKSNNHYLYQQYEKCNDQ